MKQIFSASKIVLSKKSYLFGFLFLIPLAFLFFILIQVWTIPGNSFTLQTSILAPKDYLLMVILAFLVSLFLVMQVFIFRNSFSTKAKLVSVGSSGLGGYSVMFAAVLGTATCASCLVALFGFLGFGGIVFLMNNQPYIVGISLILLLISLYFLSRKVNGVCESCRIERRHLK